MTDSQSLYEVGGATVDITPSLERTVYMAGFAPNRKAHGVLHPLTAGILFVKDSAGESLCLITLDLIGFMHPDVEKVREAVKDVIEPDRVIICATHSHAGPDTMGLWGKAFLGFLPYASGVDPAYVQELVHKVSQGVRQAMKEAVPCTLRAGSFQAPQHLVRNDRTVGGRFDQVTVLLAESQDGVEIALTNFAAHPEALWEKNHLISADYPAPFRDRLKELGVETPLFFSGPLGAMLTPNVPPKSDPTQRQQYIETMGRELADVVVEQFPNLRPVTGPIRLETERFSIINTNSNFEWARRLGIFDRAIDDKLIATQMTVGRLGDFVFATVPGEASPEVGHELLQALGTQPAMIFCLGQDELGYILPSNFFARKEYKYETTMSLGVHMAPTVVEKVRKLRDRLQP